MDVQSADQIVARIAEARRSSPDGAIAFDGDGTLWSGDVGEDFFRALVAHDDFREVARAQMRADARELGVAIEAASDGGDEGSGASLARQIFAAYEAGRFPEERICELIAWCTAGWSEDELRAFAARQVAGNVLLPRLHREAIRALEWARAQGIETFIVSASPRAIVVQAAKSVGVLEDHVVAATPLSDASSPSPRVLPRVHRPIPYGPGKVSALRERIGDRVLLAAFGDNAFDVALLQSARVPVAVRPKPRLRDRAAEVKMLVEIANER